MSGSDPSGALAELYEDRIGTARTDDEVRGYWLFALGVLCGALGVIVFGFTAPGTGTRALGYALVALSPPLAMLGAVVRFPLRRSATTLAALGTLLTAFAVLYFLVVFPDGWSRSGGNGVVNALYAAGIVLIGLAGAVVPMVTDPVYEEVETLREESAGTATEMEGTAAELDETTAELEETQTRVRELEEELAAASAELETLRTSRARFELYEDRAGETRWRLRHRNGNVVADSGQGYSSRQKAQQGMHSVMRNALGAGVLRIDPEADEADEVDAGEGKDADPVPADADDPDVAVPTEDEDVASRATFELFEDAEGDWRWRLRHENGNVIGDSGEGYASKSNAKRATARVREHVAGADYLRIDPAAFEIYRDAAGDHRWRLVHENGNVLADSGEGYSSRTKARQGLDSVRSNAPDAAVENV
ncbi:HVO_2922 family protein [Haloparvum sedimenti]